MGGDPVGRKRLIDADALIQNLIDTTIGPFDTFDVVQIRHFIDDYANAHSVEPEPEINVFDTEEVHHNCTVEIWKNSTTGAVSIGWYPEGKRDRDKMIII